MADYLNGVPKYVVSGTLEEPLRWNNSTLIRGNTAEEIARLKRQPGKDITILGNGTLVGSLLRDGLHDELKLMVHPVVIGSGKRLFEDEVDRKAPELVDSKTFRTGVLYLTYRPAAEKGADLPRPTGGGDLASSATQDGLARALKALVAVAVAVRSLGQAPEPLSIPRVLPANPHISQWSRGDSNP
jgi:hypothetical protein